MIILKPLQKQKTLSYWIKYWKEDNENTNDDEASWMDRDGAHVGLCFGGECGNVLITPCEKDTEVMPVPTMYTSVMTGV